MPISHAGSSTIISYYTGTGKKLKAVYLREICTTNMEAKVAGPQAEWNFQHHPFTTWTPHSYLTYVTTEKKQNRRTHVQTMQQQRYYRCGLRMGPQLPRNQ